MSSDACFMRNAEEKNMNKDIQHMSCNTNTSKEEQMNLNLRICQKMHTNQYYNLLNAILNLHAQSLRYIIN